AISAPRMPSSTLLVALAVMTAAYAPTSIMPSIAILTTPLRSEITPPRAGSNNNAPNWRVAAQRSLDNSTRTNTCKNTISPPRPDQNDAQKQMFPLLEGERYL